MSLNTDSIVGPLALGSFGRRSLRRRGRCGFKGLACAHYVASAHCCNRCSGTVDTRHLYSIGSRRCRAPKRSSRHCDDGQNSFHISDYGFTSAAKLSTFSPSPKFLRHKNRHNPTFMAKSTRHRQNRVILAQAVIAVHLFNSVWIKTSFCTDKSEMLLYMHRLRNRRKRDSLPTRSYAPGDRQKF